MFCPTCGKNLPDNARFCDGCGNAIAAQADGLYPEEVQRVLDFIAGIKAARKG